MSDLAATAGPIDGVTYPVVLGETMLRKDSHGCTVLRFDFYPSSINEKAGGTMASLDSNVTLSLTRHDERKWDLQGVKRVAREQDPETVMWFDAARQCYVIERVEELVSSLRNVQ
eukprot:c7283_g1_i1.p1 GENE.c7283_g1_i1~~c7283_g1_i1.p1  ORF type:complete len:123 (-),score=22.10 c7283_g1_i1:378-722(-)